MAASRTPGHSAGLTRAAILHAALDLVDRQGLTALSMRRLGAQLGVEAMTLYHHFSNKEALLDGLVEQVMSQAVPPDFVALPWRTALRDYAVAFLAALLDHPHVITLAATRPAITEANLRMVEQAVESLCRAGFDVVQAADVVYSIAGFVLGQAMSLHTAGLDDVQRTRGQAQRLSELDPQRYPLLAAAAASGSASQTRFTFALEAMLDGFAAVVAPQQP